MIGEAQPRLSFLPESTEAHQHASCVNGPQNEKVMDTAQQSDYRQAHGI